MSWFDINNYTVFKTWHFIWNGGEKNCGPLKKKSSFMSSTFVKGLKGLFSDFPKIHNKRNVWRQTGGLMSQNSPQCCICCQVLPVWGGWWESSLWSASMGTGPGPGPAPPETTQPIWPQDRHDHLSKVQGDKDILGTIFISVRESKRISWAPHMSNPVSSPGDSVWRGWPRVPIGLVISVDTMAQRSGAKLFSQGANRANSSSTGHCLIVGKLTLPLTR